MIVTDFGMSGSTGRINGGGTPPRAGGAAALRAEALAQHRPPRPDRAAADSAPRPRGTAGAARARGAADVSVDSTDTYQASLFSEGPPVAAADFGALASARAGRVRVAVRCRPPFPEEVTT